MVSKAMKVVLVSDSHGKMGPLLDILEAHPDADLFLHAGDIECEVFGLERYHIVAGNNDLYYDYPKQQILATPFGDLLLIHSHQVYGRERAQQLVHLAKKHHCKIVCFGHTHVRMDAELEGIRLFNPGSLYYNRDGLAKGYLILHISETQVISDFIEYKTA
ncbi:MAG: metallophosphoesterase family protein [Erysipelotrichaceae bacterium]